jgi:Fe-S cluster assembly protein SufD
METQIEKPVANLDAYSAKFEALANELRDRQPAWVFPMRKAAMARFVNLGMPSTAREDWRFTNVAPILELPFEPVLASRNRRQG